MKKALIAFVLGQALQVIILVVAVHLTYASNTILFCVIGGVSATIILSAGVALDRIELAVRENDMEEAAPLPKEIKVTNDMVESDAPKIGPKTGSNADQTKEGKRIRIAFEGNPSPLMEETLKEATK